MKITKFLLIFALLVSTAFAQPKILLTWDTSPTPNVDHYSVYRSLTSGGPYTLMGTVPATRLNFTNGGNPDGSPLIVGQTYWYVVVSVLGANVSPNSNEANATAPAPITVQPPPNVKATPSQ